MVDRDLGYSEIQTPSRLEYMCMHCREAQGHRHSLLDTLLVMKSIRAQLSRVLMMKLRLLHKERRNMALS